MILSTDKGDLAFAARTPDVWAKYSTLASDTLAGQSVTPEGALSLAAVYGAVSMISATNGTMPLETIDTRATSGSRIVEGGYTAPMLKHQPNTDMSGVDLWTLVNAHLLLRGNAYLAKFKDEQGVVRELYPINPAYVHPYRDEDGRKLFRVQISGTGGLLDKTFTSDVILHIKGQSFDDGVMGASPIAVVRNRIGVHQAQSEYQGRSYQDGMLIKGVLSSPQNNLSAETAQRIKQQWRSAYGGVGNSHDIAVLHSGVTFEKVALSPEDAQFIQTMKWGHTEIATIYNIPASRLNGEGTSLTYANQGQDDLFYYKQACFPIIRRIESALNMDPDLFGFQSAWVPKFNPDAVLRADIETRFSVYRTGRDIGAFSVNDVRHYEDLSPVEGGDDYTPLAGKASSNGDGGNSQPAAAGARELRSGEHRADGGLVQIPPIQVNVPESPAPIVNVTVPDPAVPVVNVEAPQVSVEAPTVNVAAPEVTVEPRFDVPVPEVTVDVAAPEVTVSPSIVIEEPPDTGKTVKFSRDAQGRIVSAKVDS